MSFSFILMFFLVYKREKLFLIHFLLILFESFVQILWSEI